MVLISEIGAAVCGPLPVFNLPGNPTTINKIGSLKKHI